MSGKQSDPSPEQIAAACREIQSGWTADEKQKRLRADLRPTFRRCDGQRETFDADDYEGHHTQRGAILEGVSDG